MKLRHPIYLYIYTLILTNYIFIPLFVRKFPVNIGMLFSYVVLGDVLSSFNVSLSISVTRKLEKLCML